MEVINKGNKYYVKKPVIMTWEIKEHDDGEIDFIKPCEPYIYDRTVYVTDSPNDAYDYILRRLDKEFRHAYLNLKKISHDWSYETMYSPISKDMVESIKKEIGLPMVHDATGIHKQYAYMSIDDQNKYKQEKYNELSKRLWKAFDIDNCEYLTQKGETKEIRHFSNENIEAYNKSKYYKEYKSEVMNSFTKLLNNYVVEPQEESSNINTSANIRKTAPTLVEGWGCYIIFMALEIIFTGTIGLWIPTTILFIIWRKKEIRKYNWEMNEYEKRHYDPWKKKY